MLAFRSARKFPSLTNTNPLLKARTLLTLFVELANSLSRFFVAFFELNFSLSCLPAWQDIRGCVLKETTGGGTNNKACTSFPNLTSQLVCNPDRKTTEILMSNAVLLFSATNEEKPYEQLLQLATVLEWLGVVCDSVLGPWTKTGETVRILPFAFTAM